MSSDGHPVPSGTLEIVDEKREPSSLTDASTRSARAQSPNRQFMDTITSNLRDTQSDLNSNAAAVEAKNDTKSTLSTTPLAPTDSVRSDVAVRDVELKNPQPKVPQMQYQNRLSSLSTTSTQDHIPSPNTLARTLLSSSSEVKGGGSLLSTDLRESMVRGRGVSTSEPPGMEHSTIDEGKHDQLVGLRREIRSKQGADDDNHAPATSSSEWQMMRNLQLTALRLAKKKRESSSPAEEVPSDLHTNQGFFSVMAAKNIAKKLHAKARMRNAAKWEELIKKSKASQKPIHAFPEVVELMKAGIPSKVRGAVWKEFLGVDKQKRKHPKDYYKLLCSNANYVIKKFIGTKKGSPKGAAPYQMPEWLSQIEKDVPRTLPMAPVMKTEEGREALRRILICYYFRNPQAVGYCQGMNLVAAGLLSAMPEDDAFWALVCVIESRIGYYTKSMAGLLVDQHVLSSLISYYLPGLYDHLKKLEVTVASFTTSWFICLFMETPVPYEVCLGLWDYLFCYGDEMLFQVALAALKKKRKEMLDIDDSGMLLVYTLKLGHDLEQYLLSEVSSKLGELIQSISTLRRSFQIKVQDDHMTITNINTRERIKKRYKIESDGEVQSLWTTFISPSPWAIMVQNCIPSMVWFSSALVKACYARESRKWRESGLLSGFTLQLFHILDVHGTGQISFENFVWLSRILTHGSIRERAKLAFRFFDIGGDRRVGKNDLLVALKRIGRMYDGRNKEQKRRMYLLVNSFLFWYQTAGVSRSSLKDDVFVKVTIPSKPFGFSIGELRIGDTKLLEVSGVDGKAAINAGVEPGWKIAKINEHTAEGLDVPDLVKLCKEATVPCSITFKTPADHRMKSEEFIRCIDALNRLEPRILPLFFGRHSHSQKSARAPSSRAPLSSRTLPGRKTRQGSADSSQATRKADRLISWLKDKVSGGPGNKK
mmetsp:Transcript_15714/g.38760  ORF Transcript_15714/g.38760 Transcript_15714/m.38760 type:complete len:934 (-) Transcript_15714:366-3167(-)|eukprot:CAMPEP_0114493662 /NCGR_PEP_ID=MMETSP0109-20121206/4226_1 /TAXON_ID=29199 /ORGANISM="Chlorarachnion reptans, Strain CCCM449" /LENGTH=933 /DNA_ID=CAMNT_0001670623 /DNA_START=178 /DNA_END=2979 /DNA_ORIENTATION=-